MTSVPTLNGTCNDGSIEGKQTIYETDSCGISIHKKNRSRLGKF